MRRALLALALISITGLAACSSGGTGGTIQGVRWVLSSHDVSGTATPVPGGVTVDATFEAGTVDGSGGCNSYNASYKVNGSKIEIGQIASTLILCDGPGGDVETAYFAALPTAASFTATGDTLTLFNASGAAILVYKAGPANPLVGDWAVTGYNDGATGVVSPATGTELTATFGEDGTLAGSAGCNTYNGSYTQTGEAIAIGQLATTRKACEEAVMTQETKFLAALQASTSYRINGDVLTLVQSDGSNGVTLVPAS
ncbi:MAG TPA: META domain-containing protein [Candidatus Limnocylindrales bacterium]|nr:META domain-containing protein [Candidatus Limnocylindrales bacterium]